MDVVCVQGGVALMLWVTTRRATDFARGGCTASSVIRGEVGAECHSCAEPLTWPTTVTVFEGHIGPSQWHVWLSVPTLTGDALRLSLRTSMARPAGAGYS